MVISIAMLGLAMAGTVLSLFPRLKAESNIGTYAALAGMSMLVGYLISNSLSFDPSEIGWNAYKIMYVGVYYIFLSLPFLFTGAVIATAFSIRSERSETIYFSDLLGAGIGCLAVMGILHFGSPTNAIILASIFCFISSFIVAGKKVRAAVLLFAILCCGLLAIQPQFMRIDLSPYRNLSLALKHPGAKHLDTYYNSFSRIDTLLSPAVRFAPGLSLGYLDPLPDQVGVVLDGSEMNAITDARDEDGLRFLGYLPSALAYEMNGALEDSEVLVMDPQGGFQALMAKFYGAGGIWKVEGNPLMMEIVQKEYGEFSGNIYQHNSSSGLGRSWLKKTDGSFDIIDMSTVGAAMGGSFGMAENYEYTVEAFAEYLSSLKVDGMLSLAFYLLPPPRVELRALATVVEALNRAGVEDPSKHIAAMRTWDVVSIVVKRTPIDDGDIGRIKGFSESRRFDLVYYPGMSKEESNRYVKMPTDEYYSAFQAILHPGTRGSFIHHYVFDIRPVHDDDPFFGYYLKLGNVKEIYRIMGQKWQFFIEQGYLLPAILVQVTLLCVLLILFPVLKMGRQGAARPLNALWSTLLYFAMLGIGFMFVEITLIQKSILMLEQPTYAVATVLTAILVSSGLGSQVSARARWLARPYSLVLIGFLIIVYAYLFPVVTNALLQHLLIFKIPIIFALLVPLGFFMGIPFPMGIKLLGHRSPGLIPWAWAINGCFSVLAPILTIMLAMWLGFTSVLYMSAVAYGLAFLSLLFNLAYHGDETDASHLNHI